MYHKLGHQTQKYLDMILYKNYYWMIIKYNIFKLVVAAIISLIFYYISIGLTTNISLLLISTIYTLGGIVCFIVMFKRSRFQIIK